jgi:hypothetical protein
MTRAHEAARRITGAGVIPTPYKERIMAAIDDINRHPVVHTWSYKLDQAA